MIKASINILGIQLILLGFLLWGIGQYKWPIVHLEVIWGAAIAGSQVAMLMWLGHRILHKKGVALTLLVSVFKYGILLGIFILAFQGQIKITQGFLLGFLTVVPSLLGLMALKPKMNGSANGSL